MATATLSRGSTSVTFDVVQDGKGLAIARDIGKPQGDFKDVGHEDPRHRDDFNAADVFTVIGRLQGSSAYDDAQTLAESLIKGSLSSSNPLFLDLSNFPSRGKYEVAPASQNAASLSYNPGIRNQVGLQLSLNLVDSTNGVTQSTQSYGSPDSGTADIKLERAGNSVTLTKDVSVVRSVGRPSIKLLPQPATLPIAADQNKPANDVFEISGDFTGANAESDAQVLEELIVREPLATDTIELHFLDNLFSLDKYPVVPDGSQALRTTSSTAETGRIGVETLALRVVNNP